MQLLSAPSPSKTAHTKGLWYRRCRVRTVRSPPSLSKPFELARLLTSLVVATLLSDKLETLESLTNSLESKICQSGDCHSLLNSVFSAELAKVVKTDDDSLSDSVS